ncbi:MAG: ABC transporter ATP-binding protein [Deltaproteobacteria bacterium]
MTDEGNFRWLWRGYLKPYWPLIALAIVLMSIEGGTIGAVAYMLKPMFDQIFAVRDMDAISWVALTIFGIFILRAVSGFAQRLLVAYVGQQVIARLQSQLVRHILTLDRGFFRDNSPGVLIERVRGDSAAAQGIWVSVIGAATRDVTALGSLLVAAMVIDWRWTLIAIAAVPLFILPAYIVQQFIRRMARRVREAAARLATRLDEMFHGHVTIKLNGIESREAGRYDAEMKTLIGRQIRAEAGLAVLPAMTDVIAALGFLAVMFWGASEIVAGTKTQGDFMAFFAAITLIFEPLRRLGSVGGSWAAASASFIRLREVFAATPEILPPAQPVAVPDRPADITFDAVDFAYGEDRVLKHLSFTAKAGQTTALVGASGAGKTTVFQLIMRLADPVAGRVTLGGTDLRDFDPSALRQAMSVVSQDTSLFDETIADNITLGADASPEALINALKAAHVDEFLPRLAHGIDTQAGVRGSALSGGQRQRVAIARAVLRDRPLLLLDEATSALDAHSEKHIQAAIKGLAQGRTVLVIAHRLATVRDADQIIVMEAGELVEQGSHDDLLAKNGAYARLFHSQFAEGKT